MNTLINSKLEGERRLHDLNAKLQNALRSPVDHRHIREIAWAICDLEADILRLEIKQSAQEPDLPQDSVFLRTVQ